MNPMQSPNTGVGRGLHRPQPSYRAAQARLGNRWRWGALELTTQVYYFADKYGRKAAEQLAERLNREAR